MTRRCRTVGLARRKAAGRLAPVLCCSSFRSIRLKAVFADAAKGTLFDAFQALPDRTRAVMAGRLNWRSWKYDKTIRQQLPWLIY